MHTPFAFQPGDDQDPRDENGQIIYDRGVTLIDTWRAMESLVDQGRSRAIGLSDISLSALSILYEHARIKPAVVQVEAHPYLPETELLQFCKEERVVFLAFAPLGHGISPGPLDDPVISTVADDSEEHRRKFCWLGPCSGNRIAHHPEDCRTSPGEFQHLRLTPRCIRAITESPPDSDSTASLTAAARDSSRGEANFTTPYLCALLNA